MAIEVVGVAPLLQAHDMPTSVRFYRDLLGFEVVSTSPPLAEDYFHWRLLRLGAAETSGWPRRMPAGTRTSAC